MYDGVHDDKQAFSRSLHIFSREEKKMKLTLMDSDRPNAGEGRDSGPTGLESGSREPFWG